ncbi:hypothetical protein MYX06_04970 [Patescibacteria group bacterium AH-259-L05]|nr:hypothetical protein [Patescibacteria group bacterium AH-259-L05]
MNLKANIYKYKAVFILVILILIFTAMGSQYLKEDNQTSDKLKELIYEQVSPDQTKKVLVYEMKFDPRLYKGYYEEYFSNSLIISVRELESGRENYIFTGEAYGSYPHWLGNEHVFFTSRCGTACKGLYLIRAGDKETRFGGLSYMFSKEQGVWVAYFRDWFDQKFQFDWFVDEMYSEIVNEKTYLIFKLGDDNGNYVGEKRFIFTGNQLHEID